MMYLIVGGDFTLPKIRAPKKKAAEERRAIRGIVQELGETGSKEEEYKPWEHEDQCSRQLPEGKKKHADRRRDVTGLDSAEKRRMEEKNPPETGGRRGKTLTNGSQNKR